MTKESLFGFALAISVLKRKRVSAKVTLKKSHNSPKPLGFLGR